MAGKDISEMLKGLTSDDVHIDQMGRLVITKPDVINKISNSGISDAVRGRAAGNIICTGSDATAARELIERLGGK